MNAEQSAAHAHRLLERYRVEDPKSFKLSACDPDDTGDFSKQDKSSSKAALEAVVAELSELQEKLYAQDRWALLLIFQAMDAAGKDSAIKHVMSGVNPQGCQVYSFKSPSHEELDHDYLWRCMQRLPERGRIGIFNRSYYEETLVVRVHPQLLEHQRIPKRLLGPDIWEQRFADIRHLERYMGHNGIVVRKFFLHLSKAEQRRRFLKRLEQPAKHWKFAPSDIAERAHWEAYQSAYEETIRATATAQAPWYAIPADHKWFTRLIVAAAIVDTLRSLDLAYPRLSAAQEAELAAARQKLADEA